MTQYLTYDEYAEFGGTLDESTFNELEFDARAFVDWVTFNRLQNDTTFPEAVKMCMYRLIQILQAKLAASATPQLDGSTVGVVGAGITGQSNDGVSITYNVMSAKDTIAQSNEEMWRCVRMYLQGVKNELGRKVLYRGIYPDE